MAVASTKPVCGPDARECCARRQASRQANGRRGGTRPAAQALALHCLQLSVLQPRRCPRPSRNSRRRTCNQQQTFCNLGSPRSLMVIQPCLKVRKFRPFVQLWFLLAALPIQPPELSVDEEAKIACRNSNLFFLEHVKNSRNSTCSPAKGSFFRGSN